MEFSVLFAVFQFTFVDYYSEFSVLLVSLVFSSSTSLFFNEYLIFRVYYSVPKLWSWIVEFSVPMVFPILDFTLSIWFFRVFYSVHRLWFWIVKFSVPIVSLVFSVPNSLFYSWVFDSPNLISSKISVRFRGFDSDFSVLMFSFVFSVPNFRFYFWVFDFISHLFRVFYSDLNFYFEFSVLSFQFWEVSILSQFPIMVLSVSFRISRSYF